MAAVIAGPRTGPWCSRSSRPGRCREPKAEKQPTAAERGRSSPGSRRCAATRRASNAGDPGLVLARRLSNAEYNYTIRDLTGVDIRPTREFPVDPANQAGFDNSGESLAMSPALLKKYLQAAREVAEPPGARSRRLRLRAAPDARRDRPRQVLRPAASSTSTARRTPTTPTTSSAAWRYKHRAALGRPAGHARAIAAEAKVSPKYLATVWSTLEGQRRDRRPARQAAGDVARAAGAADRSATSRRERLRARCATTSCSCARRSSRASRTSTARAIDAARSRS